MRRSRRRRSSKETKCKCMHQRSISASPVIDADSPPVLSRLQERLFSLSLLEIVSLSNAQEEAKGMNDQGRPENEKEKKKKTRDQPGTDETPQIAMITRCRKIVSEYNTGK